MVLRDFDTKPYSNLVTQQFNFLHVTQWLILYSSINSWKCWQEKHLKVFLFVFSHSPTGEQLELKACCRIYTCQVSPINDCFKKNCSNKCSWVQDVLLLTLHFILPLTDIHDSGSTLKWIHKIFCWLRTIFHWNNLKTDANTFICLTLMPFNL